MNDTQATKPAHDAPASLATIPQQSTPLALAGELGGERPSGLGVLNALRLEPKSFDEALVVANIAAAMNLGDCKTKENAMVRIMRGATLGIDAMTSIENIDVINDRTSLRSRLMHSVVLRSPLCEKLQILEDESNDKIGIVLAKRRGEPEQRFRFTIEDAEKLVGASKLKDPAANWHKDTKGMLIARALSRACNRTWPDVTNGFVTPEELRDVVEVNPSTGAATVTREFVPVDVRNWEAEAVALKSKIAAASSDAAFATLRKEVERLIGEAPSGIAAEVRNAFNAAKTAFKAANAPKETPANG